MSSRAQRRLVYALLVGVVVMGLISLLSRGRAAKPRMEGPAGSGSLASPPTGMVTYVYDGDTVEVRGIGKVRLIGIDAMDGHNEDRTAQQSERYGMSADRVRHWAEQAAQFARQKLEGGKVTVHFGPEHTDRHGRVLAYVRLCEDGDAADHGLLMLQRGLAAAYHSIWYARREEYLAAERQAREARAGMWQDARIRP